MKTAAKEPVSGVFAFACAEGSDRERRVGRFFLCMYIFIYKMDGAYAYSKVLLIYLRRRRRRSSRPLLLRLDPTDGLLQAFTLEQGGELLHGPDVIRKPRLDARVRASREV